MRGNEVSRLCEQMFRTSVRYVKIFSFFEFAS
jgi:hypothetical protein